ncbi:MAG: TrbI/VirB10 family protein, partial [Mesorhizobium sp.]
MTDTENNAGPMRLRAEPPRVTRLSRKVLASVGAVALVGIGGALIYALQTRDAGKSGKELYSTDNRQTADGLAGLPRDYTGPVLGPALPGDLGRPIVNAQNRGQPVVPPTIVTQTVDRAEERRLAEEEAARISKVFFQTEARTTNPSGSQGSMAMPNPIGLDLAGLNGQTGQPTAQDKQLAFLNAAVDRRTTSMDRVMPPASPY